MNPPLIWQPSGLYQPGYDFGILLDGDFAREMAAIRLPPGIRDKFNELAIETLQSFGVDWSCPINFYRDSALVHEIHIGEGGAWLNAPLSDMGWLFRGTQNQKRLDYSSHNIRFSSQAYAIMAVFDRWVTYSDTLKELSAR